MTYLLLRLYCLLYVLFIYFLSSDVLILKDLVSQASAARKSSKDDCNIIAVIFIINYTIIIHLSYTFGMIN